SGTGSSRSDAGSRPVEPASAPEIPDWPQPTKDEVASTEAPRYYAPTSDTSMSLTIEALGLYDVPVINSYSYEALDRGLMHEPDTSLPWDVGAQRNVYIAGHYLGWPGTASHLVFYNLDKLKSGDEILLKDSAGNAYRYRASESFMAGPDESWVMGQVQSRDMLTLQTCIPPTFEDRLVVRADRA
ncbi:MAG: sortase, partial [Actinobacteria bacterium]|nr:sortase [Actinomycetota bacterium]